MLTPSPFAALSDISVRHGVEPESWWSLSPLQEAGKAVDMMRTPEPATKELGSCDQDATPYSESPDSTPIHPPFWPLTLLALLALGVAGAAAATRRLTVPAKALPRGIRLA